MTIDECIFRLTKLASGQDPKVRFLAARLKENLLLVRDFKSEGMYTEAKYSTRFMNQRAEQLQCDDSLDPCVQAALQQIITFGEEILKLPDTLRLEDRSALLQTLRRDASRDTELEEKFPIGSVVKIAPLNDLLQFMDTWKLHHPLQAEQLKYADFVTRVKSVGYYHGGDAVYTLVGTDNFAWLAQCLRHTSGLPSG